MKYTKLLSLFTLLLIVALSSCKKEEIDDIKDPVIEEIVPEVTSSNQLVFNVQSNSADGLDLDCFTVDFPFGLNIDGELSNITSEEEFFAALEGEPELIDFVYPINVTYEDGETAVANDGVELGELFAACIPDTGWTGTDGFPAYLICDINSCFQLVYPVSLHDGNGNTLTADSEEAFVELIVENPELYFNFPVNLIDSDGNPVSATSDEELFNLVASCDDIYNPGPDSTDYGFNGLGCYDFVFPFGIIDQNGDILTVNDENEFVNAMFSGDFTNFAFPISFTNENGDMVVANDDEDLNSLLMDCDDPSFDMIPLQVHIGQSSLLGGTCYDLVYPFSGIDVETGENIQITSDEEANEAANNQDSLFLLNFPISIVKIDTGETLVFDDADSYFEFLEDCE